MRCAFSQAFAGTCSDRRRTAGEHSKERPASTALFLIDIPAKKSEYSNVSKLCYLTWESAEIRR